MVNNVFIGGLILFFIVWEVLYLYQRKHPNFFVGGYMIEPTTWAEYKMAALINIISVFLVCGIIGAIFWALNDAGVLIESIIVCITIAIFFGLNYLFRNDKKRGRK